MLGAMAGQPPLLAGKLTTPAVRPGTVVRERLLRRLDETLSTPLGLVVAAAGWGKTKLLSQWAAQADCRVAWLTLDESDDEPPRFWTYVATALNRQVPQVGAGALAALRVPTVDPLEVAVPTLLNDLAANPASVVLILDDYHTLSQRRIHEELEYLLTYLPPSTHVVIGARFDPPLPLARMRARGELTEVRADELRFADHEAAGLVAAVADVTLTGEPLNGLVQGRRVEAGGAHLGRSQRPAGPRSADPRRRARTVYPFVGDTFAVLTIGGLLVLTVVALRRRRSVDH